MGPSYFFGPCRTPRRWCLVLSSVTRCNLIATFCLEVSHLARPPSPHSTRKPRLLSLDLLAPNPHEISSSLENNCAVRCYRASESHYFYLRPVSPTTRSLARCVGAAPCIPHLPPAARSDLQLGVTGISACATATDRKTFFPPLLSSSLPSRVKTEAIVETSSWQ